MTTPTRGGKRHVVVVLVVMLVGVAFAAAGCPSNRNGIEGQLAQARDEAQSAARSGALALESWQRGRSTASLVSVQLSNARDDVVEAYQGAAELSVSAGANADWQRSLAGAMNHVVDLLNTAGVVVDQEPPTQTSDELHRELLAAAEALTGRPPS